MNYSPLRQIILDFPLQFKKALEFSKNIKQEGRFNKLIVCGMGGSALPADIIKTFLEEKKIDLPTYICRNYDLPFFADKNSIVFVSSYSGNTEETLSCFAQAQKKEIKMVSFAKGGKLEKLCKENGIPFVKYPDDGVTLQPRFAIGYAVCSMLCVLINSKIIPGFIDDIKNLISNLKPASLENQGKELAQKSKNLIPLFYASSRYGESVARICKIKINENSKTQAFWNVFPELNHNEMVGFTKLAGKFHIIILKDPEDLPRILKRMQITRQILEKKEILVSEVKMEGASVLEKIFNTLITGAWMSYYLALECGQDPIPVAMVEEFKKKMG
ncbi:MAG: bifunctional phosphoglucose/phosphomannose isomerase [Patescibacteria group bacterium]